MSHRNTLPRPSQGRSSFSLIFLVWSPTPGHSQILPNVRLGSWGTVRGGKPQSGQSLDFSWPFVVNWSLSFYKQHKAGLGGLSAKQGQEWSGAGERHANGHTDPSPGSPDTSWLQSITMRHSGGYSVLGSHAGETEKATLHVSCLASSHWTTEAPTFPF